MIIKNGANPTLNPMLRFMSIKFTTKCPKYLNPHRVMVKDKSVRRNLIILVSFFTLSVNKPKVFCTNLYKHRVPKKRQAEFRIEQINHLYFIFSKVPLGRLICSNQSKRLITKIIVDQIISSVLRGIFLFKILTFIFDVLHRAKITLWSLSLLYSWINVPVLRAIWE